MSDLAKFEWQDETGLCHPSLVYLDITDIPNDLPFVHILEQARIIRTKQIYSFGDVFGRRATLKGVRTPKGMEFCWHKFAMDDEYYAVFVAYRQKNTVRLCSEMA